MEGLDIRTLALTNVLLGLFLGVGSLIFARMHPFFLGFRSLSYSYLLFAFGFIILFLDSYIPYMISTIIANVAITAGFSYLILGILKFLKYKRKAFKSISRTLVLLMTTFFVYFTYFEVNIEAQIIIISVIIGGFSLFAGVKVLRNQERLIFTYTRALGWSFIIGAVVFLLRAYFTFYQQSSGTFLNEHTIHALSLIVLQLISITSCFSLTLSANHQLTHKLEIQATIDPLTTIYNRRAFDELALNIVARAQRQCSPLSIVLIDVDYFKQVNDEYGHQIGDKLLKEFSARLKGCLRQYDILARYGGEEFVLLLPDTNADTAVLIAEKLRYSILHPEFVIDNNIPLNVTASFGVATNQGVHINWQQFIAFADQALYYAKDSGRNCVKLHSASVHQISVIEQRQ